MIVPHRPGAATRSLVVRGWMLRTLSIIGLLALLSLGTLVSLTHNSALQTVDQLAEANRRAAELTDSLESMRVERDSLLSAQAVAASVAAANATAASAARAAAARRKPVPRVLALHVAHPSIMLAGEPRDLTPDDGVALPVDGRITSGFSHSRFHPILGIFRPHHGVDVSAPAGTPIAVPAAGVVHFVGRKWQAGLVVEVQHAGGIMTRYEHCRTALVRAGDRVEMGRVIATVGSSGLATGPHVHYEVLVNGTAVDPLHFHFASANAATTVAPNDNAATP